MASNVRRDFRDTNLNDVTVAGSEQSFNHHEQIIMGLQCKTVAAPIGKISIERRIGK